MNKDIKARPMVSEIMTNEFIQNQAKAIREDRELMWKTGDMKRTAASAPKSVVEEEKKDPFEGLTAK